VGREHVERGCRKSGDDVEPLTGCRRIGDGVKRSNDYATRRPDAPDEVGNAE